MSPEHFFANYTKRTSALPKPVWQVLRVLTLLATLGFAVLLAVDPAVGLKLWWGLAIPVLPAVLVIAPGLWRQVCPMAFLNQIPRMTGTSRSLPLPGKWKEHAFLIAVAIFLACVAARSPVLNHAGGLVAAGIVGVLIAALVGGLVFAGRSGWCGTFCPLGPIQRTYGHAPLIVVPNGYCPTCVGCQKNCYDFNPRGAIFADLVDSDPRYASQRRLFIGLLPGLIAEVTDRATGIAFQVMPEQSLLEAIEQAGLKIGFGCRAGVCGADPVAVCEGGEHLSPPGDDEIATLQRLGLEGRARLACMCTVRGPVLIDRDPRRGGGAGQRAAPAEVDKARLPASLRVVIVGDGVAGMSAAEALAPRQPEPAHRDRRQRAAALLQPHGHRPPGLRRRGRRWRRCAVPEDWAAARDIRVHRGAVALQLDRQSTAAWA
jgi:ferredoxin